MRRKMVIVICSLVILLSAVAVAQEKAAGDNAAFITDFTAKLSFLQRQVSLARWEYLTTGKSDSLDVYQDWYETLVGNPKNPPAIANRLAKEKDSRTARQLELLHRLTLRHAVDNRPEVREYLQSQSRTLNSGLLQFEGKEVTADEMHTMMMSESNRQRRRTIYEAMIAPGTDRAKVISQVANLRNTAAKALGFSSYYDLILDANGIDREQLDNLIAEIDKLTAEPYQKMVDSLKRALNVNRLSAWDIDYAFRRADSRSAGYFAPDNFLRLAKMTFDGLGIKLDALPLYFESVSEGVSLDKPELITVAIPDDFRIPLGMPGGNINFNRFIAVIFDALYGYNMDDAEYMFMRPAAPCMNEAMYWIATELINTDAWNRKYAGMPEPLVLTVISRERFNRLYRIRKALAMIAFEKELYKDPLADLNAHYTAIQNKVLDLTDDANGYPWAVNGNFIEAPAQSANRLLGFVVGAQLSHYLNDKYGSMLDNEKTREFLVQNIFRFGAREDWVLLVERATGERLTPNYLVSSSR